MTEITQEDVDVFMESLRRKGTPWADGCAALIGTLWNGYTPRPEAVAHSDHPLRHWDRTCPACIADPVPTKAHIVYCYQHIRDCLKELLRLYDWRNELGGIERDFNHDKKQMSRWLNQYGREKKQAWFLARELLEGGRKTPDFAPSPLAPSTEEKP